MATGASQAGTWALIILLYLVAISIFSYFYTGAVIELNTTSDITLNSPISSQQNVFIQQSGFCGTPRNEDFYLADGVGQSASLDCQAVAVQSQQLCEAITGCSWVNQSYSYFFGLISATINSTCDGLVSIPYLLNGSSIIKTYRPDYGGYIEINDSSLYSSATGAFIFYGTKVLRSTELGLFDYVSVCETPRLQEERSCSDFGCTWYDSSRSDIVKPNAFGQTIQFMFGFSGGFDTDSSFVNFILRFIFIFVPIVVLVIAVAMFARG